MEGGKSVVVAARMSGPEDFFGGQRCNHMLTFVEDGQSVTRLCDLVAA
jgi:hypothetical protein